MILGKPIKTQFNQNTITIFIAVDQNALRASRLDMDAITEVFGSNNKLKKGTIYRANSMFATHYFNLWPPYSLTTIPAAELAKLELAVTEVLR